MTQAEAEAEIISAELTLGNITQEYDPNISAGYVISQEPEAALTRNINSPVNLVISRGPQMEVALELIAKGLSAPVGLVPSNDGTGRLFIVDQTGLIKILMPDGEVLPEPFLDIRDKMGELQESYDERGLLGLAFHPDFETNGRFFVYYSAPLSDQAIIQGRANWNHTSHVSEFMVELNDNNKADPDSEDILLKIDQPQSNHNGGQLVFGPDDGYLYISLGDGGRANDTGLGHPDIGNGQSILTLLGSILRINVDNTTPPLNYAIPQSNPFSGITGLDEIFAFGFRNPFRMSFDAGGNHDLFVADVGQNIWEEVNIVEKGKNYGWNIKEGTHCFDPTNPTVMPPSCPNIGPSGIPLTHPIIEYQNSKVPGGLGRAVIGGFVYRGNFLPELYEKYVFGDWSTSVNQPDGTLFIATPPPSSGALWIIGEILVANSEDNRLNEHVLSFGEDPNRELYLLTSESSGPSGETGKVYRIVPSSGSIPFVNVFDQRLSMADPNQVTIAVVGYDGPGWIVIHDASTAIIGYTSIEPGINTDVPVGLTREIVDGEELHAMLHKDANALGVFEFPGLDIPVTGDRGVIIVRPFTVNLCDQPTVPDVVGMTLSQAEAEIASCSLFLGNITQAYSNTISAGIVIDQNPEAGILVPAGTMINLLVSLGSQPTVSFSANVQPIFNNSCIGCHSLGGIAGFLPLTNGVSHNNLVNRPATRTGSPPSGILAKPFDSGNSVLYQRVSSIGLPVNENRMPPSGPALSLQAQVIIKTWIDEGTQAN